MKHLKKARDIVGMDEKYPAINTIEVDGNKVTFTIQDGPIGEVGVNGVQVTDMLQFVREVYTGLNEDFRCRENSLTITHIDEALNWQDRRTKDREKRGVEGKNML